MHVCWQDLPAPPEVVARPIWEFPTICQIRSGPYYAYTTVSAPLRHPITALMAGIEFVEDWLQRNGEPESVEEAVKPLVGIDSIDLLTPVE